MLYCCWKYSAIVISFPADSFMKVSCSNGAHDGGLNSVVSEGQAYLMEVLLGLGWGWSCLVADFQDELPGGPCTRQLLCLQPAVCC